MRKVSTVCILFSSVVGIALCVSSCVSPLDPDTPRKKTVVYDTVPVHPHAPGRLRAAITVFIVQESAVVWASVLPDTIMEIDTSQSPARIWLRATAIRQPDFSPGKFIASLSLKADSIAADGVDSDLFGDPRTGTGALFVIGNARDSTSYTIIDSVVATPAGIITSAIQFTHNPSRREIDGSYTAIMAAPYRLHINATIKAIY
jgi:hypothetical protein